ncbi:hypothetical protein IMF23_01380 [Chelatococcus daeguensis]|uniref:hypothetical protein n=1 Tax=Chelatococcus daeguensis TaxID=444444 RepID=UPI0012FBFC2D|nr:hypothetical protein [Chelatococcus daeguensis]MBM3082078.1 hypothetical protein [Chelatococcus daeguensis]
MAAGGCCHAARCVVSYRNGATSEGSVPAMGWALESFEADTVFRLPWPETGDEVRFVERAGGLWFVAADVCRSLRFTLNRAGAINVTQALACVGPDDKMLVRLETSPGTFRPFTRYMLVSEAGLEALVAEGLVRRAPAVDAVDLPAVARLVRSAARNLVVALGGRTDSASHGSGEACRKAAPRPAVGG